MNKKNPHREILPAALAKPLLNVPTAGSTTYSSVWLRLEAAQRELRAAVAEANDEVTNNPLAEILAEHAMRLVGKRGAPLIEIDPDGSIMLVVQYEAVVKATLKHQHTLPPIKVLRVEAEGLGIDTTAYGKNKKKLLAAIKAEHIKSSMSPASLEALRQRKPPVAAEEKRALPPLPDVVPDVPKPKMMKTAPALSPVRVIQPDDQRVLLDDDDGLGALFPDAAPPKDALPATTPIKPSGPPKPTTPHRVMGGRTLSAIAGAAEAEINIDALLAKPAPAPPTDDD